MLREILTWNVNAQHKSIRQYCVVQSSDISMKKSCAISALISMLITMLYLLKGKLEKRES